jgi:hypothetical protein
MSGQRIWSILGILGLEMVVGAAELTSCLLAMIEPPLEAALMHKLDAAAALTRRYKVVLFCSKCVVADPTAQLAGIVILIVLHYPLPAQNAVSPPPTS